MLRRDVCELLGELRQLPQWVAYRRVWNASKGRYAKLPLNPHDGSNAKANDAGTWGTFDGAVQYASENCLMGNAGGIGFEFANGYAGIDLDGVILAEGTLKPFAEDVVRIMGSYTEYSPSGRGLHILFKLHEPLSELGTHRRNDELGIEMYDSGRFFTVTGNIYGEARPIAERTEAARKVYAKYLAKSQSKGAEKVLLDVSERVNLEGLSGNELLERMFSSLHGAEIRGLYDGDVSRYGGDDSRADLALCSYLAFWTNNDLRMMDSLFRQSGLMRSKWDEKRGGQTYGMMTLLKALGNTEGYKIINASKSYVREIANPGIKPLPQVNAEVDRISSISDYVESEGGEVTLEMELDRFSMYKDRKTGYSNLDAKMSLYPGLYVLGAISSLGKTTFCGQMADQLAFAGEHVLYFSLEQTRLELVTKGLSRLMAQADMRSALTSMEIRRGMKSEALKAAREVYVSRGKNEYIVECGFDTNVDVIVGTVKDYISRTGVKPVVMVDYLQIITPVSTHQTTKDVVDYNVRALKKLQTENDLVVLVISSLNRQNYLTPIDFSSFKESGGIEYTADVIWGLQLSVMNEELFDREAKLKAKREAVKEAKVAHPREIELVCLKNRYGVSSYSCNFKYYAKYDLFVPERDA
ncbi:MAG: hypothetical protein IJQ75_04385 [Synergistaceae bacterium]|nr:hypothetical protein [Synergistaceae bacterium]